MKRTLNEKHGWVWVIRHFCDCCSENTRENSLKHMQRNCHTAKFIGFHQSQHLDRTAVWSNMVNCYPYSNGMIFVTWTGSCKECSFYSLPKHTRCHKMSRLIQAFYAIKLPCLREKTDEITDNTSVLKQEWHILVIPPQNKARKFSNSKEPKNQ